MKEVHIETGIHLPIKGLGSITEDLVRKKGKIPKERTYKWSSAIFYSTDYIGINLLENIERENPNGYLVGVGIGGIISLLEGFSHEPISVISVDINPYVVAAGRLFVNTLKDSLSYHGLVRDFFDLPYDEYQSRIQELAEKDDLLKRGMARWKTHEYRNSDESTPMESWRISRRFAETKPESERINVPKAIEVNFEALRRLAQNDNIAVCLADISENNFIKLLRRLPGFSEKTNILYLSNAVRLSENKSRFKKLKNLNMSGNRCVYVYSLVGDTHLRLADSVKEVIEKS